MAWSHCSFRRDSHNTRGLFRSIRTASSTFHRGTVSLRYTLGRRLDKQNDASSVRGTPETANQRPPPRRWMTLEGFMRTILRARSAVSPLGAAKSRGTRTAGIATADRVVTYTHTLVSERRTRHGCRPGTTPYNTLDRCRTSPISSSTGRSGTVLLRYSCRRSPGWLRRLPRWGSLGWWLLWREGRVRY